MASTRFVLLHQPQVEGEGNYQTKHDAEGDDEKILGLKIAQSGLAAVVAFKARHPAGQHRAGNSEPTSKQNDGFRTFGSALPDRRCTPNRVEFIAESRLPRLPLIVNNCASPSRTCDPENRLVHLWILFGFYGLTCADNHPFGGCFGLYL